MDGFHGIVPQLQLMGGTTSAQAKEFILQPDFLRESNQVSLLIK